MHMSFKYELKVADILIDIQSEFNIYIDESLKEFISYDTGSVSMYTVNIIHDENINNTQYRNRFIEKIDVENVFYDEFTTVYVRDNILVNIFEMVRRDKKEYAVMKKDGNKVHIYVDNGFREMFETEGKFYTYLGIEYMLMEHMAFYLHSSLVDTKYGAIIFAGSSGIGKSTQGSLWGKYRSAKIINGDRSIVKHTDEGYRAYGSPFAGSSGIFINRYAPVRAIVFLEKGTNNNIERLTEMRAFMLIFEHALSNAWDKQFVSKIMDMIADLVKVVPVYYLNCTPDEEAIKTLENALDGGI